MGVLDGRVVMVTGAANGIGRQIALIAAAEGAKVLVNDLGGGPHGGDTGSAGPAEAVAQLIREAGGAAISNSHSVTDYEAVVDMREQALAKFGALHAVINPAGILRDGMFHKMRNEDWDVVIDVHLRGTYNVCRATIEHFRDQQDGAYVLFSSTSGLIGNIGQTNYGAAKMGIAGLSRILALEGASKNVRSNVLAPGAWTRLVASIPVKDEAAAKRMQQLAQTMPPDSPAKLAVALASPAASSVSGQIFGVQGADISVMSQIRSVDFREKAGGWTPASILAEALPGLARSFTPLSGGPGGAFTRPAAKAATAAAS
jgi:NAD(P)-dependent dehydrogenase (short-subunit alcohol dehydrogenase family)